MQTRNALGLAFGTKKSKKAIQSLTTNAITSSQGRQNPTTSSSSPPPLDPLASAVLSTMPATTSTTATTSDQAAELEAAKPRPKANLDAQTPQEVYDPNVLAGGADVLAKIKVKDWIDAVKAGRDVPLPSLYVAKRIPSVVGTGKDVPRLRLLKYVFLLLRWYKALKPAQGKKRGRMVPRIESPDLLSLNTEFGTELVAGLKKRFADEAGELNKWHVDNFVTHVLACMLVIDGFEVDTHNAAFDLGLEQGALANYFKELGCAVGKMSKKDCEDRGLSRAEGSSRRLARLRLPLVFPKLRVRGGK